VRWVFALTQVGAMPQQMTFSDKESAYARRNEISRRFLQNALELALAFGDFQKVIDSHGPPGAVLGKTIKRIRSLVRFEAAALYLVHEATADLRSVACWPNRTKQWVTDEMAFLLDHGLAARALRERRGVTVFTKDGTHQVLLHAIATHARVRGLFIGIFPADLRSLPDASLEILSIVLRNTANALESLACYSLMREQRDNLEKGVRQETEKVASYEKQMMQAQRAKAIAVLAGGVAHHFNNALTALMGNLDLLEMIGEKNPEVKEHIDRLRPISQRMAGLTHQMLAYAQGSQSRQRVVSLQKLVRDVTAAIRRVINPMTRLVFELPPDHVKAEVDVTQMQIALLAIVGNADEALEGEGQIRICAHAMTAENAGGDFPADLDPGGYVCISIQDTGAGMDPETLQRVFEPFFSTKAVGRGLGMAVASGIARNHGGWIHLDSQAGRGTCARVYLPAAKR
jgi:signal transduction histidine kinase